MGTVVARSGTGERNHMALGIEDRLAVMELIALHGHVIDDGELHRLDELFTDDIVLAMGALNPVGHHVTKPPDGSTPRGRPPCGGHLPRGCAFQTPSSPDVSST